MQSDLTTEPQTPVESEKQKDANHIGTTNDSGETGEDDIQYPSLAVLVTIAVGLCLCAFLVSLDQTILATAIPRIVDDFNSIQDISWYGSAYMLTTAALQLPFGTLYTVAPIKWTFITAVAIFEVGSAICGAAQNSKTLIVGRAIAGIGSSGLMSGAMIIISKSAPLHRRAMFIGLLVAMFGIASVCGPPLGGAFTDHLTWRWCFLINLPLGAITVIVLVVFFRPPSTPSGNAPPSLWSVAQSFDLPGLAILLPTVICLMLGITWGGNVYPWSDWREILLLVLAGVGTVAFVALEAFRPASAMVPPRLVRQRTVASSCILAFGLNGGLTIAIYYLPLFFQGVKGSTAVQSGVQLIPTVVGTSIFAIIGGIGVALVGYFVPFMIVGCAVFTAGCAVVYAALTPDTSSSAWIGFQVLIGAGAGLTLQQAMIAVQTVLPEADIPVATAFAIFCQTLGGAVFLAISQAVFAHGLAALPVEANGDGSPGSGFVVSDPSTLPSGALGTYAKAVVTPFLVAAVGGGIALLSSAGMEWVSVKKKRSQNEQKDAPKP
ncbi:MFS general substrate transporter [Thozetella sp. PMI_491]|nr:MFS general substrate transporter [Thozetella sp. PMI_491]